MFDFKKKCKVDNYGFWLPCHAGGVTVSTSINDEGSVLCTIWGSVSYVLSAVLSGIGSVLCHYILDIILIAGTSCIFNAISWLKYICLIATQTIIFGRSVANIIFRAMKLYYKIFFTKFYRISRSSHMTQQSYLFGSTHWQHCILYIMKSYKSS